MDAVEISRVLPLHVDCSKTARCQRRGREWLSGLGFRAWTAPVLVVICKPCSLVDLIKFNQGMIVSSYIIFPPPNATNFVPMPAPFFSPSSPRLRF